MKTAKTKIVCTIGPSTWDSKVLRELIDNGMTVARINASFADAAEIQRVGRSVRKLSKKVALMLDLKGHKIRLSDFNEPLHLKRGDTFVLDCVKNSRFISITYPALYKQVEKGVKLLIDDGKVVLNVIGTDGTKVITKVETGGIITRSKTVNVVGANLDFPALTKKDREDIKTAVAEGYDFIAGSYIRDKEDVRLIVRAANAAGGGGTTKVISKIESAEGVANLDEILKESFGVMIARGDLGVELPYEQTPVLQKEIVEKCNALGKPVIVATQMLESMVHNPSPTRAEVSDVSNAVMDGADALMLSAETSTGEYPVEAVKSMARVVRYIEETLEPKVIEVNAVARPSTNAIAEAVIDICAKLPVNKILVATGSGTTARVVSRHRPRQPVIAFTKEVSSMRSLALTKGVTASLLPKIEASRGTAVTQIIRQAYKKGFVSKSDMVVVVAGANIKNIGATNMLEVEKVSDVV